jgi:excisionase family DNA binding protein
MTPRVLSIRSPRPPGALLTLNEAAAYLGISPGTLKNWVSMKRIAYVKVGALTRFRQAALDAYIDAHTVEAVRQPKI